jgi:cytochrome P450
MATDPTHDYPEMIRTFDIYDEKTPVVMDDVFDYARAKCPVPHVDANEGYYLVTRYQDVRAVLTDDATFSSRGGKSQPSHQLLDMPPIDVDPPIHNDYRKLLNRFFSKAGLAKHEPAIREIARSLVDGFVERGRIEILGDYATPLTSATLCRVILNLDDEELTRTATARVEGIGGSNSAQAWQELTAFLIELMAERGRSEHDDVLTAVMKGSVEGRPLTDEDKLGVMMILFLGGLDTTRAAISSITRHLVLEPSLQDRLRDPEWVTRDLDEFLRLDSVVTCLARTVTGPTELGGTPLGAGDRVLVHYYAANHDPGQFANPRSLDFERERNPHVAFGLGVHRCIGSNLARMQIRVAFEELLSRVENIRPADPAEIRFTPGVTKAPGAVPIVFDPR